MRSASRHRLSLWLICAALGPLGCGGSSKKKNNQAPAPIERAETETGPQVLDVRQASGPCSEFTLLANLALESHVDHGPQDLGRFRNEALKSLAKDLKKDLPPSDPETCQDLETLKEALSDKAMYNYALASSAFFSSLDKSSELAMRAAAYSSVPICKGCPLKWYLRLCDDRRSL